MIFFFLRFPVVVLGSPGISYCNFVSVESLSLFFIVSKHDFFVHNDVESYYAIQITI